MNLLIHIDTAKREILAADSLLKVKDLWNKADAMRALGQAAKDPELVNYATEFKLRCERRLGEMLAGPNGIKHGGQNKRDTTPINSLSTLEIDANLSSRAQRIASVPEDQFETVLGKAREDEQQITRRAVSELLGMAHVGHNSGVSEWYTPKEFIEAARGVMGSIDLDPASSDAAQEIIKARQFFTKGDDGLSRIWGGNIWLNPPYSQPLISQFIDKLVTSQYEQFICLVNNATETEWGQKLLAHLTAVCFPDGRIKFWSLAKESAAPLQGQMIGYCGPAKEIFISKFGVFGVCFAQ